MTAHRKPMTSAAEHAAMFKFLDRYANKRYDNDVGGLLGQLSVLREGAPLEHEYDRQWRKAVSLAVSVH